MNVLQYITLSSICISIFYIAYRLMFRNEVNLNQLRFYLLASIGVSVIIPISSITLNVDFIKNIFAPETPALIFPIQEVIPISSTTVIPMPATQSIDWWLVTKSIYIIVASILLIRIVVQILSLIIQYYKSERVKMGSYVIISSKGRNTFSFFNWIFISRESSTNEEIDQIISHEKVHASQYHTIDLIMIELLAAVMWFNPLVWMMRGSIQLVHEYLADEGALSTGIDRLRYQALLLNQAAEERLICLSSSFNHSLIKKRMIMMTKQKFNRRTKLRILALIPVSAIALMFTSGVNGLFANNVDLKSKIIEQKIEANKSIVASDTVKVKKVIVTKESNAKTYTVKVESNSNDDSELVWVSSDDLADSTNKVLNKSKKEIIILHKGNDNQHKDTIIVIDEKGKVPTNILYFIDGVEQSDKSTLDKIDSKTIDKIEVYKGAQIKKYTTKDCDGVILISTKKDIDSSNVLYLVDGTEQPNAIKELDPNNIKEIKVVKGEKMKKYTTKNYDGVILITTKKGGK